MEPETCLDNLESKNKAGYINFQLCSFHMDLFHDDFSFLCPLIRDKHCSERVHATHVRATGLRAVQV